MVHKTILYIVLFLILLYDKRLLSHSYEFGPRDFAIILTSVLELLLIGFTIYQYLPSAPKGIHIYA
jgi:hypothetical protein